MPHDLLCTNCHAKQVMCLQRVSSLYGLYHCKKCLLIFTYPHPKKIQNQNNKIYDSLDELKGRIANFSFEYARARKHILAFNKYKKSGKYLDVGCSYGIGLKVAKKLGYEVMGVEPTRQAAAYGKRNFHVKIIQKTLLNAKLASNFYDVVSLYDVLEHVPNLKTFLKEVRRILKPKGLLVIQSPNIKSFAFASLQTDWNWLLVPNHLWHFSEKSITMLLEKNGFAVKKITTEDNIFDFASNLKSKIFHYKNPNTFIEKVIQKGTYIGLYVFIFLCSPIWNFFKKGGSLQVYAFKK